MPRVTDRIVEAVKHRREEVQRVRAAHAELIATHTKRAEEMRLYISGLEEELRAMPGIKLVPDEVEKDKTWVVFPGSDLMSLCLDLYEEDQSITYDFIGTQYFKRTLGRIRWWARATREFWHHYDLMYVADLGIEQEVIIFENIIVDKVIYSVSHLNGHADRIQDYTLWDHLGPNSTQSSSDSGTRRRRLIRTNEDDHSCQPAQDQAQPETQKTESGTYNQDIQI